MTIILKRENANAPLDKLSAALVETSGSNSFNSLFVELFELTAQSNFDQIATNSMYIAPIIENTQIFLTQESAIGEITDTWTGDTMHIDLGSYNRQDSSDLPFSTMAWWQASCNSNVTAVHNGIYHTDYRIDELVHTNNAIAMSDLHTMRTCTDACFHNTDCALLTFADRASPPEAQPNRCHHYLNFDLLTNAITTPQGTFASGSNQTCAPKQK